MQKPLVASAPLSGRSPVSGEQGLGANGTDAAIWRFASRWPLNDQTVWTIVNRNEYDVDGQQMQVAVNPVSATSISTTERN